MGWCFPQHFKRFGVGLLLLEAFSFSYSLALQVHSHFFVQTWPPYLENGLSVKVSPKLFFRVVTFMLTRYSLSHRCVYVVWMMPFISLSNICSMISTKFENIFCFQFNLFSSFKNKHYKKSQHFKRPTWPSVCIDQMVCPFWLNVWGMKNTCYIWLIYLTKATFLTKCQVKDLVKIDKRP